MITGLVLGKFMPFHKGHMALIDYAKSNCDKLIIFLAADIDEPIPYKHRLKWVLSTYLDDPQVEVFGDIIDEPPILGDELSKWWEIMLQNDLEKLIVYLLLRVMERRLQNQLTQKIGFLIKHEQLCQYQAQ